MPKIIAFLHYTAPSIVGGVESVMSHHARLMLDDGYHVRIIAGRGRTVHEAVEYVHLPLADSRHPAVLAAKARLDQGQIPADFDQLIDTLAQSLTKALAGVDVLIAHNVCSLHKSLALTAAVRRVCAAPDAPRLIIWHHDLAWTSRRYRPELHQGWPWDLVHQDWPEVQPRHVAVSELRRRQLADLFGLPPAAITVVPSGLNAVEFLMLAPQTAELVHKLHLLQADPLLLLPVRITRRKNIELALRTVAAMSPAFPGVSLIVTGPPGPHNPDNEAYFNELKSLRTALGLNTTPNAANEIAGPAVHFLTEIVDEYLPNTIIGDFYNLADALLLPSREEGFGIPIIEAGLAALPIFCADIAPLREIAGDNATYFSPDADPDTLAQQITAELCSRPVYQLRRHVRHHYTWEGVYTNRIAPLLEVK